MVSFLAVVASKLSTWSSAEHVSMENVLTRQKSNNFLLQIRKCLTRSSLFAFGLILSLFQKQKSSIILHEVNFFCLFFWNSNFDMLALVGCNILYKWNICCYHLEIDFLSVILVSRFLIYNFRIWKSIDFLKNVKRLSAISSFSCSWGFSFLFLLIPV